MGAEMTEPAPGQPWAFIAHKDNHWAGITAANGPPKDLGKFLGDFASKGFSITTVYSRDEYNKTLGGMKSWHEHPDYPGKKSQ